MLSIILRRNFKKLLFVISFALWGVKTSKYALISLQNWICFWLSYFLYATIFLPSESAVLLSSSFLWKKNPWTNIILASEISILRARKKVCCSSFSRKRFIWKKVVVFSWQDSMTVSFEMKIRNVRFLRCKSQCRVSEDLFKPFEIVCVSFSKHA